jgi:hypothetical protein
MARSTHPSYSAAERYERRANRRNRREDLDTTTAIALSLDAA